MIRSFTPTSPELQKLLGKEPIEFTPGANLIVGPNGAGKTSLLRAMAWQCAIIKEGAPKPLTYNWERKIEGKDYWRKEQYPDQLGTDFLLGTADWDAEHAYLFRPAHYAGRPHTFDGRGDIEKFSDMKASMVEKRSTGTEVLSLLQRLDERVLAHWNTTDLLEMAILRLEEEMEGWGGQDVGKDWRSEWTSFNSKHGEHHARFCRWLEKLRAEKGRSHIPTLMMDEPDEHLAPGAVLEFYRHIVPSYVEKGWQVIIVTHSPFALALEDANIIEVGVKGFHSGMQSAIIALAEGLKESARA